MNIIIDDFFTLKSLAEQIRARGPIEMTRVFSSIRNGGEVSNYETGEMLQLDSFQALILRAIAIREHKICVFGPGVKRAEALGCTIGTLNEKHNYADVYLPRG